MADALSLLRQYTIENKRIDEREGHIIFGDLSWQTTALTNFVIYSTTDNKDDGSKSYYTLGCLLYFLKNEHLPHPKYVQQAAGDKVPVVHRPDRKILLDYLHGENQKIPASIDKAARLEMPTHVKRTADDRIEPPSAKKAKLDSNASQQQIRERMAAKLDAPQERNLSLNSANLKDLSDKLNRDKIAELRAKMLSNKRTKIKSDYEDAKAPALSGFLDSSRQASTVFSRERQYRTRTTILQSSGKTFAKTINAILTSVKAREEGKVSKPTHQTPRPGGMPPPMMSQQPQPSQPRQLPNYNRYDQEQFRGKDDTHGFNIETTGTFSGMTLKSVTEGNANARKQQQQSQQQSHGSTPGSKVPGISSSNSPNMSSSSGGKRPSRTPIIIIPAAPKSMVTMYNAKDILQDLRFILTEDIKAKAGLKRENELLIQRRKPGGLTVPYRVIDNPAKLSPADWNRVVAVFVMGQAWQFKGWPWGGNPTQIFSNICAFHLKWDEAILEKNIGNWAVNIIQLSRTTRHLDRARLQIFWEILDKYMVNNKPHLRF